MRALLSVGIVSCLCSGCAVTLPQTGPGVDEVFAAAKQVIQDQYPMSAPVTRSNVIVAVSNGELDGSYKTRRQITVRLRRNYTGAWDPQVRVVKHVETSEPRLAADPESPDPGHAHPVGFRKWTPLQHMTYEEQELRERILKALNYS